MRYERSSRKRAAAAAAAAAVEYIFLFLGPSWSNGSLLPLISSELPHTLILIRWWGLQSRSQRSEKPLGLIFVLFFFSAKNLKYKNRKKHPKRIHLRKHTHTHNNIHLPPVRLQFSPRNRVCNKIFFRCVSRAWEHREADRRERQQQKKKKLLFWRWLSRVSRRRWRRRQSV